jgi:hypothetical protein
MIACHCGDPGTAEADLKPLRQFGPPAADLIQPMPYPAINTLSDAGYPKGAFNYWKSAFFTDLSDAPLEIMIDALHRCPSPMSGLAIVPYLGAVNRVDATATAFAHRAPGYSLLIVAQWPDARETEPNITWARETFDALHPYMADRSYVNNLTAEDGRMVHQVWGANYERLVTIKRRYDPGNIFQAQPQHRPIGVGERGIHRARPLVVLRAGVVAGAVPVHHDHRFVADHPGVVALRQRGDIAGLRVELGAIGHHDVQRAAHVVLEVRRFAQLGACQRLHVLRPAPAGLQGKPADLGAADPQQVEGAPLERACLVRCSEPLLFCLVAHDDPPLTRPVLQRGRRRLQPDCSARRDRCLIAA